MMDISDRPMNMEIFFASTFKGFKVYLFMKHNGNTKKVVCNIGKTLFQTQTCQAAKQDKDPVIAFCS